MPTVFLDAVFKPFFKIVHDTGQQLTIDWTNFLTDGFLQIIQCMGFVSVNMGFQIPPKEKNHMLKDRENEGVMARLRNGKWGAQETCFELWSLTRLQCVLWHHLVESGQPRGKGAGHLAPPSLRLPTEYYTFKRCQVPVGYLYILFICKGKHCPTVGIWIEYCLAGSIKVAFCHMLKINILKFSSFNVKVL